MVMNLTAKRDCDVVMPVIVKYANGVFTPENPVSLPEESRFLLVPLPEESDAKETRHPVGSKEAQQAFIDFCRTKPFNTGVPVTKRDELYERF